MKYGSVCSGIEAASVAWHELGFEPAWFSEIEPFPSAVLAHHWPRTANYGDMLRLPDMVANGDILAPDVLVGGTPCQAFSVAGKRGSLEDERGALTLAYVELANEIDRVRQSDGSDPCIIVWENVPGVLNTKDNAFGCFLAGLAGESEPLVAAGGRWTNAGCVFGPQRTVAWRTLDAQYFGLAQRRRRVFVVASARDGFDPTEVLFERDGLRRDTAPSRKTGQSPAADAGAGAAGGSHWGSLTNPHPYLNQSHNTGGIGASNQEVFSQRGAGTVQSGFRMKAFGEYADDDSASTVKARDYKDATDLAVTTVTGDQLTHALNTANNGKGSSEDGTGRGVPTIAHTVALRGRDGGATAEVGGEVATALRASTGGGDKPHVLAFSAKDYGADATDNLSPTMRAGDHSKSHANGGVMPAIASLLAVRRLTPRECERLQGFPDEHTLVPHRNKPAADGPRYKALGNSMAVPVMRWVGKRIKNHLETNEGMPS